MYEVELEILKVSTQEKIGVCDKPRMRFLASLVSR